MENGNEILLENRSLYQYQQTLMKRGKTRKSV